MQDGTQRGMFIIIIQFCFKDFIIHYACMYIYVGRHTFMGIGGHGGQGCQISLELMLQFVRPLLSELESKTESSTKAAYVHNC